MALLGATKLAKAVINAFDGAIVSLWSSYYFATQLYTQNEKFSPKSVNLCKFTTWCTDVLADKPHRWFDTKLLSKKVGLIRWCLRVHNFWKRRQPPEAYPNFWNIFSGNFHFVWFSVWNFWNFQLNGLLFGNSTISGFTRTFLRKYTGMYHLFSFGKFQNFWLNGNHP